MVMEPQENMRKLIHLEGFTFFNRMFAGTSKTLLNHVNPRLPLGRARKFHLRVRYQKHHQSNRVLVIRHVGLSQEVVPVVCIQHLGISDVRPTPTLEWSMPQMAVQTCRDNTANSRDS